MLSGPRSARRRRGRNARAARIAIPVAAVLALGVTVGVMVGTSEHGTPKLRSAADSGSSGVAATTVEDTCDIIVPAHPLTAKGLATPYQLTGPAGGSAAATGCEMTNAINLGAYVQATILDTKTGALYVYNPLVISQGTTPAVMPVVPKLPKHAIVTIDFGFNGTFLLQKGATPDALAQGNCTDGMPGSPFGQVSFCNGINFFNKAFRLERAGVLHVPSAGIAKNMVASGGSMGSGLQCPTTRSFEMIDQDPSDNVTTKYLMNSAGQTAQDNAANAASMPGAKVLVNGSDNALLDGFLDPALGCTPLMAPDLGNHGMMTTSQALDELLASRNETANAALVPENDAMVLGLGNSPDAAKTDLYRAEIGQPPVDSATNASSSPAMYCQNLVNIQTAFVAANQKVFAAWPSPVPTVGDTLYTFMANRLASSFDNLNCANFGLRQTVKVVNNGAGAATQATLSDDPQTVGF